MIAASSFVEFLFRRRWVLLILAAVLAIVSWRISLQFSYDRSIENMFADDDPILVSYHRLKRTFGGILHPQNQTVGRPQKQYGSLGSEA